MSRNKKQWEDLRDQDTLKRFDRKIIIGLTPGQNKYLDAIDKCNIILCTGPAGAGKTYMAVAKAVEAYKAGKIKKIVITRPMITCGKGLGFLPGDIMEKFAPYLRPVLDAFDDFLPVNEQERMLDQGIIELCPMELLRGTSFKDSIVILEEAQNAEYKQLKMFLTRIGKNTKLIVSGDYSQSDLDDDEFMNPFLEVFEALKGNNEIGRVKLGREDIVRSPLIKFILERLD